MSPLTNKQPIALGELSGTQPPRPGDDKTNADGFGGHDISDEDVLQARLDALRRS
jgi:charged multivesicular body protein 2A